MRVNSVRIKILDLSCKAESYTVLYYFQIRTYVVIEAMQIWLQRELILFMVRTVVY
jgi:hypothetical protein